MEVLMNTCFITFTKFGFREGKFSRLKVQIGNSKALFRGGGGDKVRLNASSSYYRSKQFYLCILNGRSFMFVDGETKERKAEL